MTSELRPAVEVFRNAVDATGAFVRFKRKSEQSAAAVIEADREAVRAEMVSKLANFVRDQDGYGEWHEVAAAIRAEFGDGHDR